MNRPLKILHAPSEIAGQMGILTSILRKLGYQAKSVNFFISQYDTKCDIELNIKPNTSKRSMAFWLGVMKMFIFFLKSLNFDIYHFHYGRTLLPYYLDLPILSALGKKIIFHFHGSDIRNKETLYKRIDWHGKDFYQVNERRQNLCLKMAKKYADRIIVSTPDLLEFVPTKKVVYLPVAIGFDELPKPEKDQLHATITVVHSPSSRQIKGTEIILAVIQEIQKSNKDIYFKLIENATHNEVIRYLQKSDLLIDQLLIGWYGKTAIEMMALGKPVVCFIRKDLMVYHPDLPIVNTEINNLSNVLRTLIDNVPLIKEIGHRSKIYAQKVHEAKVVGRRLAAVYESLL